MGPIQSVQELIAFLRRRATIILSVFLIGMVVSVIYALRQPHEYEATAVIQIEAPKISDTLAASTVEEPAARRLQTIEQRMMARDNMLQMIDNFGLFVDLPGLTNLEKVALLRHSTGIRSIAAVQQGSEEDGTISGVTVTVRLGAPELAMSVTNAFAENLVELSTADRIERTRKTLSFFQDHETTLSDQITALKEEIAAFKNQNEISISGGLRFRRIEIASVLDALLEIDRDQLTLEGERQLLTREPETRIIAREIREIDERLSNLSAQRALLEQRRDEMAESIKATPEVERQLSIYEQQLERLQEQYAGTVEARVDAELSHRMELTQQAERLRIIEYAVLPDYPVAPSRRKLAATGTLAGLAIGLFAAFLLELRKPIIRTGAQMRRELGLTPVVAIPHFASPYERNRSGLAPKVVALCLVVVVAYVAIGLMGPRFSEKFADASDCSGPECVQSQ